LNRRQVISVLAAEEGAGRNQRTNYFSNSIEGLWQIQSDGTVLHRPTKRDISFINDHPTRFSRIRANFESPESEANDECWDTEPHERSILGARPKGYCADTVYHQSEHECGFVTTVSKNVNAEEHRTYEIGAEVGCLESGRLDFRNSESVLKVLKSESLKKTNLVEDIEHSIGKSPEEKLFWGQKQAKGGYQSRDKGNGEVRLPQRNDSRICGNWVPSRRCISIRHRCPSRPSTYL